MGVGVAQGGLRDGGETEHGGVGVAQGGLSDGGETEHGGGPGVFVGGGVGVAHGGLAGGDPTAHGGLGGLFDSGKHRMRTPASSGPTYTLTFVPIGKMSP